MLEGLEISEVLFNDLEYSGRIDSEYYKPSFIKYEKLILRKKGIYLNQVSDFLIGPFGSSFTVNNYTNEQTYRYIRGKDVKPLTLMDDDNVYMPEEDYHRLSKYALQKDDILVSVVGTLGNAAIVTKEVLPAIFSCKSTVLRPNGINAAYLLTYINTKYGKELLTRKERGAIQKGLNLDDLKTLLIYRPSWIFQDRIGTLFDESLRKLDRAKQIYQQAEALLLKAIGLQDFTPSQENTNVKSFQDSFLSSGRLDAEYYQPKYEEVMHHIANQNHKRLGDIVAIKKSIEPGSSQYADEGIPFLRVSDYNKFGISEPNKKLSMAFCKEHSKIIKILKPKKDTILFSKDGTVGIAYVLKENKEIITSGAVLHLHIKSKSELLPEYLALVLNSLLVQMQAERDTGGSIILHWRPDEIKDVVVPILPLEQQKRITELIEESYELKSKSKNLLEVAKRAVEIAIEEDETAAMRYIEAET